MGSGTGVRCEYLSRCHPLHPKTLGHGDSTEKDLNYGCEYLNIALMKNKLTLNISTIKKRYKLSIILHG